MIRSQEIYITLVALAALTLGLAFALNGHVAEGVLAGCTGLLWIFGAVRRWAWAAWLGFAVFAILAAKGIWADIPVLWLTIGLIAALSAWDLDYFIRRWEEARAISNPALLARAHRIRLTSIGFLGLLLSAMAIFFPFKPGFTLMLLFGALLILGLARLVKYAREGSE